MTPHQYIHTHPDYLYAQKRVVEVRDRVMEDPYNLSLSNEFRSRKEDRDCMKWYLENQYQECVGGRV